MCLFGRHVVVLEESLLIPGGGLEEKGEDKGTEGTASCIFLSPSFFAVGLIVNIKM